MIKEGDKCEQRREWSERCGGKDAKRETVKRKYKLYFANLIIVEN